MLDYIQLWKFLKLVSKTINYYQDWVNNYDKQYWPSESGKLLSLELVAKKRGEPHFLVSQLQNIGEQTPKRAQIAYYGDLLNRCKKPIRILVEGSAGMGKTCLCIY